MAGSLHTPKHDRLIAVLVTLRKKSGLTQRQLAAALGREQSFVGRVETGQRRLDLIELAAWCSACGTDPRHEISRLLEVIGG